MHERFHYKKLPDVMATLDELGLKLPASEDLSILAQPLQVGPKTLPNRLAVHPMEGCDSGSDGTPSELVRRRYRRFAAGGSGLLWFEACAVVPEGRANPHQMMLTARNADVFREMLEECHRVARESMGEEHRPVCILQLTHSGRYSKPEGKPAPILAHHSPQLDEKMGLPPDYPLVTDEYLDRLQDAYVKAARLASEVGFDGVDVKSCHGYLIAGLLASFTREGSRYGGPEFENRTRMVREVHARIAEEVPGLIVTTRMIGYDPMPHPYGWGVDKEDHLRLDPTEPTGLARALAEQGAPIINVTLGNPYYHPNYNRPYDYPIVGFEVPDEHPLVGVDRAIQVARAIQEGNPDLAVVGSGYTYFREFMPYFAAGVLQEGWATVIGLGRGAFAYPDFARDILRSGAMERLKTCIACSCCTQIMRDGGQAGCVIRDKEVYGPIYREGRRHALDTIMKGAERCRTCTAPTCQDSCPAGVDVPGFVKAAAVGEFRRAYDILRAKNALPELCAYVCPTEVQCEGACIMGTISGQAVPIRDIQQFVCRMARQEGWAGLRVPDEESGCRIAIVGAGPAGLACAANLIEKGHAVTIFDAADAPGGIGRQTIPTHRLDSNYVAAELGARLKDVPASRLEWRFNTALGHDLTLDDVLSGGAYDAVFLSPGLMDSASLMPGASTTEGVEGALEFLRRMKSDPKARVPAKVAVLGGGNTAMDAAVVASHRGATDVYVVYRRSFGQMPAWPRERDEAVSHGVHFLILTQPTGYRTDADGRLTGLTTVRTTLGEPDASGRRRPVNVPDSEAVLDVDLVVEAIGQEPSPALAAGLPGVDLNRSGLIAIDAATMRTSRERVFAGGDIVNGGATVVQAVAEGMRAANAIDQTITQPQESAT